jgi:hypothetical protein
MAHRPTVRGTSHVVSRMDLTWCTGGECQLRRLPPMSARTSQAVEAAFREQATDELSRRALRYARQRAALLRRAGRRIDNLYARELVQDALTDTWAGVLTWDPAKRSLLKHVLDVIRYRSWKDAKWVRRSPHLSLDVHDEAAAITAEASHQLAVQAHVEPFMISELTAVVVTELQRLADGDRAATALEAWAEGVVGRSEVMRHTGMSRQEYRVARSRLTYLVRELPSSLDDAARTLLRSAS